MVLVRQLIQRALRGKEPFGRFQRCKVAPRLSAAMYSHVEERRQQSRFHFRGKTFKTWVDLDPVLMVNELQDFLSDIEASTYLVATLGDDVCCVSAELLLTTSAKAPQQSKHAQWHARVVARSPAYLCITAKQRSRMLSPFACWAGPSSAANFPPSRTSTAHTCLSETIMPAR